MAMVEVSAVVVGNIYHKVLALVASEVAPPNSVLVEDNLVGVKGPSE